MIPAEDFIRFPANDQCAVEAVLGDGLMDKSDIAFIGVSGERPQPGDWHLRLEAVVDDVH